MNARGALCAVLSLSIGAFLFQRTAKTQMSAFEDPVALLVGHIESGQTRLEYQPNASGYLSSLLRQLEINPDSQVLVFSKTSFQAPLITPAKPRAVYFNDTVSVGFVQGGPVFEIISVQPVGLNFYTLDTNLTDKPHFERRRAECLNCHGPVNTPVPGLMVTSVFPGPDGMPFSTGGFMNTVDHRTPLENRWGGWYVTGTHGSQQHMGNAVAPDLTRPADLQTEGTQNLTSLGSRLDTTPYPVPTSDIVALMTLDHQTRMTNLITRVSGLARALQLGRTDLASKQRIDAAIEDMLTYMLFIEETPLRDPVKGTSTFTQTFPRRGPRDQKGRSLRDFDLQTRLFRYPLSYMVYSEIFDRMEDAARELVYRRLYDVLTGSDTGKKFARLSAGDRRAVLDILRDTKSNLPPYRYAIPPTPQLPAGAKLLPRFRIGDAVGRRPAILKNDPRGYGNRAEQSEKHMNRLILLTLVFTASAIAQQYTKDGEFILPNDFRQWAFLSSGVGMIYSNAPNPKP